MSAAPSLAPSDHHNRALLEALHPPGWRNPQPTGRYNLVVLGAGTAGLVTASIAAGLGGRVALIEAHLNRADRREYAASRLIHHR